MFFKNSYIILLFLHYIRLIFVTFLSKYVILSQTKYQLNIDGNNFSCFVDHFTWQNVISFHLNSYIFLYRTMLHCYPFFAVLLLKPKLEMLECIINGIINHYWLFNCWLWCKLSYLSTKTGYFMLCYKFIQNLWMKCYLM